MLKTHFTIFTPHKKNPPQYNDISYKSISEARFCPQVARDIYTHTNIYMTCKCTSELGVLGEKSCFKWRLHYSRAEEAEQEPGWARTRCHPTHLARCGDNPSVPFQAMVSCFTQQDFCQCTISAECKCRASGGCAFLLSLSGSPSLFCSFFDSYKLLW